MAAKLTRLIHKIGIKLFIMAAICSSRSKRSVRKLMGTPSRDVAMDTFLGGWVIKKCQTD